MLSTATLTPNTAVVATAAWWVFDAVTARCRARALARARVADARWRPRVWRWDGTNSPFSTSLRSGQRPATGKSGMLYEGCQGPDPGNESEP